jgi:DNA polymerase V
MIPLSLSSNGTLKLVAAALYGLKRIYKAGDAYRKCGVMLMDLSPQHQRQASLFSQVDDIARHSDALMSVLDSINARYGRDTLTVAAAGTHKDWAARAENKPPCYMTRWTELPKAWAH